MNKKLSLIASLFVCSGCSITNFFTPNAKTLVKPSAFRSVVHTQNFDELAQNIRDFSAIFAHKAIEEIDDSKENNSVSPLSMYSALAVTAAITGGETKQQLLDTLKTTDALLKEEFGNLYAASNLTKTYGSTSKVYKKEELTNSIWLDKNITFKQDTLDMIADKFYSYSLSVDYRKENAKANRQMSKFVEEKTNGLLKPNFNFDINTLFTILNTLYLKSLWNDNSDTMNKSSETFDFINRDNSKSNMYLFETKYQSGKILKDEKYSSFFAQTAAGDRIKFIVPNDGTSLEEVVTPETLKKVIDEKYNGVDDENKLEYFGKTFFPGFEAECDIDAKSIIKKMGVKDLFMSGKCDVTPLTDEDGVYCEQIKHATKLKVDKKGIEGAAYTAVQFSKASAPFDEYKRIYQDFIVDKAFCYVVTDHNNIPVFTGIVNKVQ